MRGRNSRGFTVVEILCVLVTITILASIVIPRLINGLDRGKQKRTMADIRIIGSAIEAYAVDYSVHPTAGSTAQLAALLEANYINKISWTDGWSHGIVYEADAESYTLGSPGKDGGDSLSLIGGGGMMHRFDDDIIYTNGQFVQWPGGVQE